MNKNFSSSFYLHAVISVLIATCLAVIFFGSQHSSRLGNAGTGITAAVATTSIIAVGPQNVRTLAAATPSCSSRVVTTVAQPVMLSFNPLIAPNGLQGHLQAASTTVAYDSGIYGCDLLSAYGYNASTSITVSEFR